MTTEEKTAIIHLKQLEDFKFEVSMDVPEDWSTTMDEPPGLGKGEGPTAARMLAAGIGHCLSSSLLFCLQKSRIEITQGINTDVKVNIQRNDRGRWRIADVDVNIQMPAKEETSQKAFDRCLELFEDYCIVTASVKDGIPVNVNISTG